MLISILVFVHRLLLQILNLYSLIWLIWIIISWLNAFGIIRLNYYSKLVQVFSAITDGVIDRVFGNLRYKMILGNMDFSPLVFLFLLRSVIPFFISFIFRFIYRFIG